MSLIKNPPKAAVDNLQAENTTYKAPPRPSYHNNRSTAKLIAHFKYLLFSGRFSNFLKVVEEMNDSHF